MTTHTTHPYPAIPPDPPICTPCPLCWQAQTYLDDPRHLFEIRRNIKEIKTKFLEPPLPENQVRLNLSISLSRPSPFPPLPLDRTLSQVRLTLSRPLS